MKTTKEMIEVMTAYKNGAEIECCNQFGVWQAYDEGVSPTWNWSNCDYRIKEKNYNY